MALNNIAFIHAVNGDSDKELDCFNRSLAIYESLNDKKGMALTLGNLGTTYANNKEYSKAHDYYIKALLYNNEIDYNQGVAISNYNIGQNYIKQGEFAKGKPYAVASLELSKKLGFPADIRDAALLLSNIYEEENKGMAALSLHKLYMNMRDSVNSKETLSISAKQQAKYKYDKQKTIDDVEHEKLLALEQEDKEKQQILTSSIAIGLLLVIIFLFFVFNRLRVTRQQKKIIEEQKDIVEEAHKEIKDSIAYAKRIQSAILPQIKVVKAYLKESFILYKPKDIVAGDFYWMEHKDGKVLYAAADCTGHGVPGAMVSVVCNNALNRSVREYGLTDPGKILDKTREIVIQEFEKSEEEVNDGMDIALCSIEGNKLQYAGAHNPLWVIRNGEIIEIKADKQPIGKFDNPLPYTTHGFDLEQGDSIYVFSDGYIDQFGGEKGKKYKSRAFRELLLSIQDNSMEEQKAIIDNAFETWKGNLEQIDDVCVIGVKI
jgi:serine phosphatase RsbU (regulator of sigma subunit)